MAGFCLDKGVDLVDVGSENPLSEGLVNVLTGSGIRTVGPKKEYCVIESDRAFKDKLLKKIGVPKPEYQVFAGGAAHRLPAHLPLCVFAPNRGTRKAFVALNPAVGTSHCRTPAS